MTTLNAKGDPTKQDHANCFDHQKSTRKIVLVFEQTNDVRDHSEHDGDHRNDLHAST
jgi:hypothetical protein